MTPAQTRYFARCARRFAQAVRFGQPLVLWGGHPEKAVQLGSQEDRVRELARNLLHGLS